MGKNNFYPEFGVEAELPTYVYGIGVGHDQEAVKHYNPQKRVLLHLTVNGCGIAEINGKRHMLYKNRTHYIPERQSEQERDEYQN